MDWQKKEITKKIISFLLSSLLALLALIMIIGFANNNDGSSGKGVFLFAIMLAFFLLVAWSNYKSLKETIEEYRQNTDSNLLDELKLLNPYKSQSEMKTIFNTESQQAIFHDNDFTITNSFLVSSTESTIFYINGILDVKPVVQKVNGIIDYVTLYILYCDGKKYEFKFRRPLGISNMQEKANKIEYVANIVARNSDNFRKYPTCRI